MPFKSVVENMSFTKSRMYAFKQQEKIKLSTARENIPYYSSWKNMLLNSSRKFAFSPNAVEICLSTALTSS